MKSYALALIATSAMGVTMTQTTGHDTDTANRFPGMESRGGVQGVNEYDTNSDGQLNKDELRAYAESVGKLDKVDQIFNQEASVPVARAEELLEDDPTDEYDFNRAYAQLLEKVPNISDAFAQMYVNGDAHGDQDYKCTFKEFFEYINSDPGLEKKFDLQGLESWKGSGDWNNMEILKDMNFIYLAFQYRFIDGYNMNDSSTWVCETEQVEKFKNIGWLGEGSYEALTEHYRETVPFDAFSQWLDHIFIESNYVHEPDLKPESREWLKTVDDSTGGDGYITAQDLFNYVSEHNQPEFLDQLAARIDEKETMFGWLDDGIDYGYTMADILMGAYIGQEPDQERFSDRADRLLNTLGLDVPAGDSRNATPEQLEEFLIMDFLYKED